MRLLITALLLSVTALAFRQQSVGVRGKLTCGTKLLPNTQVKLWDKNKFGSDTQLAATVSDSRGNFNLSGGVGSLFKMNVHFKVYHNCDNSLHPCKRKVDLKIPDDFITRTPTVSKWFDAGTLNMAFKYPDEERQCV